MTDLYIPKSAVLELTYLCNQRCLFCSCPWEAPAGSPARLEPVEELTVGQWIEALSVLKSRGVEHLSISGGEALLKVGLLDLLRYIREDGFFNMDEEIVLISNGMAMTEDFLAAFKEYNVHLSLSLPGLSTYEKLTGADNAKGVLYWLSRAKEEGINTTCNITVTKINHHELYETIANAFIAGAETLLLNRFLAGGRGLENTARLSIDNRELNEMLDVAEEIMTTANRIGSVGTEIPVCVIEKGAGHYKKLSVGSICAACKEFFVIDPGGRIRVCNHSPRVVGHALKDPFITDTEYWNRFVERGYIPDVCVLCEDVGYCDCGCRETAYIVNGSLSALDPCFN